MILLAAMVHCCSDPAYDHKGMHMSIASSLRAPDQYSEYDIGDGAILGEPITDPETTGQITDALGAISSFDPAAGADIAAGLSSGGLTISQPMAGQVPAPAFPATSDGDTIMVSTGDIGPEDTGQLAGRIYHEYQHWKHGDPLVDPITGQPMSNGGALTDCEHAGAWALSFNFLALLDCDQVPIDCLAFSDQCKAYKSWVAACAASSGIPTTPGTSNAAPDLLTPCTCPACQ